MFIQSLTFGTVHHIFARFDEQAIRTNWVSLGRSAVAVDRRIGYQENALSVNSPVNSASYQPVLFNFGQAVQWYNQLEWSGMDPGAGDAAWDMLAAKLSAEGIEIPSANGAQHNNTASSHWKAFIDNTSTAAPWPDVLRGYYRSKNLPEAESQVSDSYLKRYQARDGRRWGYDRDVFTAPFHAWSPSDVLHISWYGLAADQRLTNLYAAAGVAQNEDRGLWDYLSQVIPPPTVLVDWANRRLWEPDYVAKYGLDGGLGASPWAIAYSQVQGFGVDQPGIPGRPDSKQDWLRLAYRASRSLPGFGEACEMQWRLRPADENPGQAVIPGFQSWLPENTVDMLRIAGYPEPIIERMMGLTNVPLNIRLVQTTLLEALKHPEIGRAAEAEFPPGYDWVKGVYLDHGHMEPSANLASRAIRARAKDEYFAEKLESEKRLRAERRAMSIQEYEAGRIGVAAAIGGMTDEFFDADMASRQIDVSDRAIHLGIVKRQIAHVRQAYVKGSISLNGVGIALGNVGVTPERQVSYATEWQWERTEDQQILSTQQVLSLLKDNMIGPPEALVRLVNLGWNNAEALVEINAMEADLARAAAMTQAKAALHAQEQHAKLVKQQQAAAAKAALEAAKVKKAADKLSMEVALALHKKLLLQSKYYAALHADNIAYAAAAKKGDQEKMDEIAAKEVTAYQEWLIGQYELASTAPEVAHETLPIETVPQPKPYTGEDSSGDAGKTPPPSVTSGEPGGGGP